MNKIKHILIDLDGTLTDPKVGIIRSVHYALSQIGVIVDENENFEWLIGPPLKQSLASILNVEPQSELAEQALNYYRERFASIGLFENKLYPNVKETLDELCQRGYYLYLATAKPHLYAVRILDYFNLSQYFKFIYGSELNGDRTDKAELIAYILEKEQFSPTACMMVGDRKYDILGARSNQIEAIAVEYGYGLKPELQLAAAKYHIQQFNQLLDLFK